MRKLWIFAIPIMLLAIFVISQEAQAATTRNTGQEAAVVQKDASGQSATAHQFAIFEAGRRTIFTAADQDHAAKSTAEARAKHDNGTEVAHKATLGKDEVAGSTKETKIAVKTRESS